MAGIHKKLIALFFIVLFLISFAVGGVGNAYAYSVNNVEVLDDLTKDKTFNLGDYPQKEGDYSLKVFQIAESTDGKLYIYVYQPCYKFELLATSINMSLSEEPDDAALYTLKYISG